jgi:hypothetical protein
MIQSDHGVLTSSLCGILLMSLWSLLSLVLGAALATLGGVVTELWRGRRDRRAAARLIYQELLFNYSLLIGIRIGDVDFEAKELARIGDGAWRDQTDKLALVQSYRDFNRLWAVYQVLLSLKAGKNASDYSMTELDAILDMIEESLLRVGAQAGVARGALAQHRELRSLVDVPRDQRISAWRKYANEDGSNSRRWHMSRRARKERLLDIDASGELALALTSQVSITLSGSDVIVKKPALPIRDATRRLPEYLNISSLVSAQIDNEFARADHELANYLEQHREADFFLATFALAFFPTKPRIIGATATLSLRRPGGAEDPEIIALSLSPMEESDVVSIQRSFSAGIRLGPTLSLDSGSSTSSEQRRPVIQGFGILTPNPSWRLYARPGRPIEGMYRLAATIQVPKGVSAWAGIRVAVQRGGIAKSLFQSDEIPFPITRHADNA